MKPTIITSLICFINIANITASSSKKMAFSSARLAATAKKAEEESSKPSSSNENPVYSDDTSDSSTSAFRRRVYRTPSKPKKVVYSDAHSCSDKYDTLSYSEESESQTSVPCPAEEGDLYQSDRLRPTTLDQNFKKQCIELTRDIKAFAKNQLGLDCFDKDIHFHEYEITNWPELVPFHLKNWDQQAYDDIRRVLPSLVFTKKTYETINKTQEASVKLRKMRRELLNDLLDVFNQQTGLNVKRIPWINYNLVGWPAGVNLAVDRLNRCGILSVSRYIDFIQFLPIQPDQKCRYVEFSDGSRWDFKGTVPRKKESVKLLKKHELSAKQSSSSTAAESSSYVEFESAGSDVAEVEPGFSVATEPSVLVPAHRTFITAKSKPITPSHITKIVRKSQKFKNDCMKLNLDIRLRAIEKLNLDCKPTEVHLADYEIENWPKFVPVHSRNWDFKAYEDLLAALDKFEFHPKQQKCTALATLKLLRRELMDLLLETFNEQTGSKSRRIFWTDYNLVGWPAGINLDFGRLNRGEILAVWRQYESGAIAFLPLEAGQTRRYVQFSDGALWEFNGKVPNRKEFTELQKQYGCTEDDQFSEKESSKSSEISDIEESEHESQTFIPVSSSSSSIVKPKSIVRKRKASKDSSSSKSSKTTKTSNGSRKSANSAPRKVTSESNSNSYAYADNDQSSGFEAEFFEAFSSSTRTDETMWTSLLSINFPPDLESEFEGLEFNFNDEKEQFHSF